MCEVWCGALCWLKVFPGLWHKDQLIQDIYLSVLRTNNWSLDHNVSKRTWVFTSFFQNQFFSITPVRILQHLKAYWAMSASPQNAFCFTNLSHLVLEIFRVFEYHAQNLNTPQNNSTSCDLQMGFNSPFKGLKVKWKSEGISFSLGQLSHIGLFPCSPGHQKYGLSKHIGHKKYCVLHLKLCKSDW